MFARHWAMEAILAHVADDDPVLSTTGMISRDAFATLDRPGNFYMVGSMGPLSSLGLGLGLAVLTRHRGVFFLESDGSTLMSLGALPLIAAKRPGNLVYIVPDNQAYESTGAQPSISSKLDLAKVAKGCGYVRVARSDGAKELDQPHWGVSQWMGRS